MRKRTIGIGTAMAVVAVGTLAGARWLAGGGAAEGAVVVRDEFRAVVEATGTLEAAVTYEIGTPGIPDVWNYNLTWMAPEGSRVQSGVPVARYDATEIEERLREHQADLEKVLQEKEKEERNLLIALRQLDLDLVKAEGELKKVDLDLSVPEELVPEIELKQSRLKRNLARRRVEFLKEKIEFEKSLVSSKLELLDVKREFSQTKIAYYEDARERFTVRAPVAGLVVYIPKHNGQRWEIGESVWMMAKILQVADVNTLQVKADVLEVDAASIRDGQPSQVTVDAIPGLRLESRVASVGKIVHPRSVQDPSRVFDVILPLPAADLPEGVRPGMSVRVEIETARLPDRLTVPLDVVHASPEGTWVEVLGPGGEPERRTVTLGPRNGERVVVESGLREGERVAFRRQEVSG